MLMIILLVISINAQSINNSFTTYTEFDGLPSNSSWAIMQDHLGYIWIGTINGLSRFDGYEFLNFSPVQKDTNFLQTPIVTALYEDSKYNLWIGAVGGITKYDRVKGTFKFYPIEKYSQIEGRTLFVSDIVETSQGDILFTVFDFYFNEVNYGLYTIAKVSNEIKRVSDIKTKGLWQILKFDNDNFYVAGDNGFGEYNNSKNTFHWFPFKEPTTVVSIRHDHDYRYWLGTFNKGLINYDTKDSTYYSYPIINQRKNNNDYFAINKVIKDQNNNIYFTSNKGLYFFNTESNTIVGTNSNLLNPTALHSDNLYYLIQDIAGSIWITGNGLGLAKYDITKSKFHAFNSANSDGLPSGWVNAVIENTNKDILLGISTGIITEFNKKDESFTNIKVGISSPINDFLIDHKKQILIGAGNGIYKLNINNWAIKKLNIDVDFESTGLYKLFEDSENNFWVGTNNGLYIFDSNFKQLSKIDFEALGIGNNFSNQVHIIVEDNIKNVWIGSDYGLFRYNLLDKKFTRIGFSTDSKKSLNSQDINTLYVGKNNKIWIGTWIGGLNCYDLKTATIESYTKKDGLNSYAVQGILGDEENGALWLSTFNGISRFNLKDKSFNNFGVEDGISSSQFSDGKAIKTSDGELIFGGSNGFTMFKPGEIINNLLPPKVLITDFKLFNESVKPGENSPLKKPIYQTKKFTLNYDDNDIEFDYLAAHYVNPKKNQYAYKLENYEDDWRYVGNQRAAIYPNLPPGKYIFHLKASNNNDVWNEAGISVEFEILPPWWKTWWAYTIYIFAFVGILGGARKFELDRRKEKENKKFLQLENKRKTKELEEARQLQLSMLPKAIPQLPHLDIAVYMKTATEVGGDYYDFNVGLDGTLTVAIGDATGHGMKAGTIVSMTKALFASGSSKLDMQTFFSHSSDALKEIELGRLMMAFMMLKIKSNTLQICNAGMPPLFIYRNNTNEVEEIMLKGMPLGAMKNFPYEIRETEVSAGDTLLLFSDGLPELKNGNEELFGYNRVNETFKSVAEKQPEEIISYLKEEGSRWVNDKEPDDDVTFVVIKLK